MPLIDSLLSMIFILKDYENGLHSLKIFVDGKLPVIVTIN